MDTPRANPPSATSPPPIDRLAMLVADGAASVDVADDAQVVVAVSGGPDSMALLHGMARLVAIDMRPWRLAVAHLDHALRPDSADDAAFVADAARALGLPYQGARVDVADLARAEGRSIEECARDARYGFLESVAPSGALIATAHTLDDSAETVIINLMRGSGLAGVAGIPARRGRVVRPLIGARRATLRALLDDAGIAYRLDPSNDDPAHLRNRIRHEVLPLLEELRSGAAERIGAFSRLAADDDRLLDELAAAELERRRRPDGAVAWGDPPAPTLARRVLRLAIGDPAPSAERIEALLEAAQGSHGGIRIELGGGRVASVRERRITLE